LRDIFRSPMLLQRTNLPSIRIVTVFWTNELGKIACFSAALSDRL
jgi:hypothetical protein